MENLKKLNSSSKRKYQKPKIKKIPLRPEEAVLGFCKSATVAGPIQSACTVLGVSCSTVGS
jgi:hypothetical protein